MPCLAWIPMEEERPNENASALPENSGIFALSAPWSLCGSKSYRGVSHEVIRSIVYSSRKNWDSAIIASHQYAFPHRVDSVKWGTLIPGFSNVEREQNQLRK